MSDLATLLTERAARVWETWHRKRASIGTEPGAQSQLGARGPLLLAALCDALRNVGPAHRAAVGAPEPERAAPPREREAWSDPGAGFDISALLAEYDLLRGAILDVVEQAGLALQLPEVRMLGDFLAGASAIALTDYSAAKKREAEATRAGVGALAEEVRAQEAQLRLVTDALPFLVSFVSADERYMYVNKAYTEWFGQPREAYVGKALHEVIGERAYQQLAPFVRRALAGERFSFEQYDVPYRAGGARDVRVTFVPQHAEAGAITGYVALLEDITARRGLERERARLARSHAEVLESMSDAFFAVDGSWRVVTVNRFYEERSGRPRDALIGRDMWEAAARDSALADELAGHYRRCMDARVPVSFLDYDLTADRWTDVRIYPTADGGIATFFRDVTDAKRAEVRQRRQGNFEQQLIGIVSHDLRNPLNVIVLSSARLGRSELDEGARKNCIRIQNAAERATRMVRDLLDFTQARLGGGIQVEPRACDLAEVVSTVVDEVEAAYPERMLDVVHEGPLRGSWDAERLAQVVQNLLTNALKYSPQDSVVRLRTRREAGCPTLSLHNDGAPIPADKLATLFEPMQRAVSGVDRATRSIGLGLYIVKHIVDAHGGAVAVTSSEAEGTTFTVRLPGGPRS